MGDFEDMFGAGTDIMDIIGGFEPEYDEPEEPEEQDRLSKAEKQADKQFAEDQAWYRSMMAAGHVRGPYLETRADALSWAASNSRPHIIRPYSDGYMVFFRTRG